MEMKCRSLVSALGLTLVLFTCACRPPESFTGSCEPVASPDAGSSLGAASLDAASLDAASPPPDAQPGPDANDPDGSIWTNTKPLASACGAASECSSGYCSDGVCCDSDCSGQCYSCAQPSSPGLCAPILGNAVPTATVPCADGMVCALDDTGLTGCKLNDGQPCTANDACASGSCLTFFVDADGDGYGVASSSRSVCASAGSLPPAGYAVIAGDCCDSDGRAHPGIPAGTYFATADGCGSFDWNCDGVLEQQTTRACPGQGSLPVAVACGQSCYATILGARVKLFAQACR